MAALCALTACASPQVEEASNGAQAQVCSREIPLGSHIQVMKCRTREQIEAERKTAEAMTEQMRARSRPADTGSGGR